MLLWLVIALGFAACVVGWHLWQGITQQEAASLFIAASLVFAAHMKYIYDEATTDHYLVSGYVTSLIHRPPFSYQCGKHQCHEPERWIVEQRPHLPRHARTLTRRIHGGDGQEECTGECAVNYPAPYSDDRSCCKTGGYAYPILVSSGKFRRTRLGDPSSVWVAYFNPIPVSDEVVYDDGDNKPIPYFTLDDYNRAHRLNAPGAATADDAMLENINAALSPRNVSVGLVVTPDNLYFEKLKRAWHQGKANDFVVVVNSPDGKSIRNVNVLGWNNYVLKENVADAIMALPSAQPEALLGALSSALNQGPGFTPANFTGYHFLDVKIPERYYVKILVFQAVFLAYMLTLLRYNPNTKESKLSWEQVGRMWDKHFRPPSPNWYLHPFTPSGIFLYFAVPFFASQALWV